MRNLIGIFVICFLSSMNILSASAGGSPLATEKATVLIVMEPQKSSGKKWDIGKGADPVICTKKGCYVGRGFLAPAKFFSGKKAYLPAVRARACSNSLSCIYRKVEISSQNEKIRPVDLDGFKRDYMERRPVSVDHSCQIESGRLVCLRGIFTAEYSMWVIPEHIAQQAGKKALDYALYRGLHDAREDYRTEFLEKQRNELPNTVSKLFELVLNESISENCSVRPDVITEAFFVTGILDSQNRAHHLALKHHILNADAESATRRLMARPKEFWHLHDAIMLLSKYADAKKRQEFSFQKGLNYRDIGNQTSLLVGWDVKSRVRKIVDQCISSLSFAEKS